MSHQFKCPVCGNEILLFEELTISDVDLGHIPDVDFYGTETTEARFICGTRSCSFEGEDIDDMIDAGYIQEVKE